MTPTEQKAHLEDSIARHKQNLVETRERQSKLNNYNDPIGLQRYQLRKWERQLGDLISEKSQELREVERMMEEVEL